MVLCGGCERECVKVCAENMPCRRSVCWEGSVGEGRGGV